MWHDTGSGASELPAGGWLEPGEHVREPGHASGGSRTCSTRPASPTASSCSPPRAATVDELCRVHTPRVRRADPGALGRPRRRCGQRGALRQRLLRDRAARGRRHDHGDRRGARRHGRQRLRARAAARPPRAARPRDGLLPLRERRRRRPSCAGGARASAGSRSSTGTCITATAPRRSSGRTRRCSRSRSIRTGSTRRAPGSSARRVPARGRARRSTCRCPRARAPVPISTRSTASSSRRSRRSRRS